MQCSVCHVDRDESDFCKRKRNGKLRRDCKECGRKRNRLSYLKHIEDRRKHNLSLADIRYKSGVVKKWRDDTRSKNKQAFLDATGMSWMCSMCGYREYPEAIEFHHTDPTTKDTIVSKLIIRKDTEVFMREALKCILVCSNCHKHIHSGARD